MASPIRVRRPIEERAPTSLKALNQLILEAPPLVKGSNRAVLGEGPIGADIAFIGEQPGDQEDLVSVVRRMRKGTHHYVPLASREAIQPPKR